MNSSSALPRLEINMDGFRKNLAAVKAKCCENGVSCTAVVKGFWALPPLARAAAGAGFPQLASSRLSQIRNMKEMGIKQPMMLIRIPAPSELYEVAELCDYSLESSVSTLQELNRCCRQLGKKHKVIIMIDLGDLREGFWDKEMALAACLHTEYDLENLELAGVGCALGCYGGVVATKEKMEELIAFAEQVETAIGRKLEMVSGGGSNAYCLLEKGELPCGITNLRIGEMISSPLESAENYNLKDELFSYLDPAVFTLKAEVIEVEVKPSYPVGELGRDGFGNIPVFVDRGMRKRAIAAVGRADAADPISLAPRLPGVTVLGASSDHLVLDIEDCQEDIRPGSVLEFSLRYGAMLALTAARDVKTVYTGENL